jgi:hypothetical protein
MREWLSATIGKKNLTGIIRVVLAVGASGIALP